jgi:hypothetical protein
MSPIIGIWLVINAVACYGIIIFSNLDSEGYPSDRLFFPKAIRFLKEDLNTSGVVVAMVIITLLFLPAILLYLAVISLIALIMLFIKFFARVFRRRD